VNFSAIQLWENLRIVAAGFARPHPSTGYAQDMLWKSTAEAPVQAAMSRFCQQIVT
jgi:hypothetical protein